MSPAVSLPIVRERPILFSAPLVRALLAGEKSQTRRIVKGAPDDRSVDRWDVFADGTWEPSGDCGMQNGLREGKGRSIRCPFGVPGDRLWVRESSWLKSAEVLLGNTIEFGEDIEHTGRVWCGREPTPPEPGEPPHVWYGADGELPELPEPAVLGFGLRWERRNSIHMPRWASRILLELTSVRIERLHALTEADATAEGIAPTAHGTFVVEDAEFSTARTAFEFLWDGINGDRCPFESDPFVWVLGLKVLSTTRLACPP